MDEHALTRLRAELRSADSELVRALARRIRLVKKIGMLKQKLEIGVVDPAAERSVIENFVASAKKAGVDERTGRRIAELLIEVSVGLQMQRRPPKAPKDSLLKQLSQKMLAAEKRGRKLIRLDIGEPRFKTPSAAAREAKRYLSQKATILYGSSEGLPELVDAIVERLNDQYGIRLQRSNVLVVPGGRFGIYAAIRSTVASLEQVVVPQPAWPAYESCVSLVGGRTLVVSTRLENCWDIDLSTLEEALKLRPKMLVLNNPSNPTGKVLSAKRFEAVMELARKYRTIVLSDEVYTSYSNVPVPTVLEHPECEAIYVNSFSKEFSMTGWRVGYVVADEQTIRKMRAFLETTLTNVPEFVQRAALAVIDDVRGEAAHARERIGKRVRMACEELREGGFEFRVPDGGFYLFPRITGREIDSKKFVDYLFTKYAVGVLPGSIFGEYRNFLRLAITESEVAVKTGIRRIVKAIGEWQRR